MPRSPQETNTEADGLARSWDCRWEKPPAGLAAASQPSPSLRASESISTEKAPSDSHITPGGGTPSHRGQPTQSLSVGKHFLILEPKSPLHIPSTVNLPTGPTSTLLGPQKISGSHHLPPGNTFFNEKLSHPLHDFFSLSYATQAYVVLVIFCHNSLYSVPIMCQALGTEQRMKRTQVPVLCSLRSGRGGRENRIYR